MRTEDVTNQVTARALSLALHPSSQVDRAAEVLAQIGTPLSLRHALVRVRRGLVEQTSVVGERAEASLILAIRLADERTLVATQPAPPTDTVAATA